MLILLNFLWVKSQKAYFQLMLLFADIHLTPNLAKLQSQGNSWLVYCHTSSATCLSRDRALTGASNGHNSVWSVPPTTACMWGMELAAFLAAKRLVGVTLEVNLRNLLHTDNKA